MGQQAHVDNDATPKPHINTTMLDRQAHKVLFIELPNLQQLLPLETQAIVKVRHLPRSQHQIRPTEQLYLQKHLHQLLSHIELFELGKSTED